MYIDETAREREELAERRRERDRHREQGRRGLPRISLAARRAFQAAMIDQINEIAAIRKHPAAMVSYRSPAGSDRERNPG